MREWTIKDLIPQRQPIMMVDKLCSASAEDATTSLFLKEDNMFCHNGCIAEAGIIEHMAQSASAMAGYNCKAAGKPAPVGFIGEVKKFTLNFLPQAGSTLSTTIKVVSEAMGITLINAATSVNGEVAATCQMKIFIRED
ncbi:MAG: hydroxymyristoyl-ACP dehydratase [Bacteroidales bacterium]|nr:hydroxymyristoyl-ACP dehydratase [Bacteroidales bacterium]MBP3342967.1 hydroxymyristoyl-ACP dehydratase [Bacteroidales bacterium]MBQ5802773.1 hydroxymyristoyl-ACP dehydratase [Bacteroidales bacterium]MBQ7998194.1 hydroxymyristoyl-ACP dehydratase [Bacteroidales bacterium]MBR4095394.1 hydroxymyristoyl-ACP dehydratase [Bacteroidales bacterium]